MFINIRTTLIALILSASIPALAAEPNITVTGTAGWSKTAEAPGQMTLVHADTKVDVTITFYASSNDARSEAQQFFNTHLAGKKNIQTQNKEVQGSKEQPHFTWICVANSTEDPTKGRGDFRSVSDPSGKKYIVHALIKGRPEHDHFMHEQVQKFIDSAVIN